VAEIVGAGEAVPTTWTWYRIVLPIKSAGMEP
jgi:hypothetical protein